MNKPRITIIFLLVMIFEKIFSQQSLPDFFVLTNTLPLFKNASVESMPALWQTYLDWYHYDRKSVVYSRAGLFFSDRQLMAYEFSPVYPKGTVIVLHGYLSHTGDFSSLINDLTRMNYRVLTFDLPGHGLSAGKRSAIQNFSEYLTAYRAFLSVVSNEIQQPLFFIGHSTGCAADLELLANPPIPVHFQAHIWLAPLVRISSWQLLQIGYDVLNPVTSEIPRIFIPSSSNKKFNKFIESSDPLQPRIISTSWAKALFEWDNVNKSYNQITNNIVVIQGTADNVVDWHYNINYYKQRMTNLKVFFIKNAKHHLAVELPRFRKQVLKIISNTLDTAEKNFTINLPKDH